MYFTTNLLAFFEKTGKTHASNSSTQASPSTTFQHNTQKQPKLQELLNWIIALKEKVKKLENELTISQNTKSLLVQNFDNLHQYQSWICLPGQGCGQTLQRRNLQPNYR